jgi:hypothetical protein
MPRSSSGRWVSRAAATGGGRRYRGQRPVNWYVVLGLIVVLGVFSVVFSRYEYQHHASATQPAVGTTLYAAYAVDVCGKMATPFGASSSTSSAGMSTPGDGVINVSPKTAAEAGNNATFDQFFADYPNAALNATTLQLPSPKKQYKVGQKCPSGTPDAGQAGVLKVEVWPNAVAKTGTFMTQTPPGNFKIGSRTLITVGFVPADTKQLLRPAQSAINLMLQFAGTVSGGTTSTSTTTTTLPSTPTTGLSTTTTTAPSGTTTSTG